MPVNLVRLAAKRNRARAKDICNECDPNCTSASLLTREVDTTLERIAAARAEIGAVIFGQELVVDLTLAVLLAGGHGLLIGVPGLAKTKLVETLGIVMGLDALRVQFTPDLMPSDILGSEVHGGGAGRQARPSASSAGRFSRSC